MAKPTKSSMKVPVEPAYEDPPSDVPPAEAPDPSAVETEPAPPEPPPVVAHPEVEGPKWFRVTKGGRFFVDGAVATLADGSCVSEATHPIDALRAAGIQLVESGPPTRPVDLYGEVIS